MSTEELVTVIIPTYKRPRLVTRAIASATQQTYLHLEIVVVDDGSGDDTEETVRAIADPRVRYVGHSYNRGLPAARNTGIRAARGVYIAFLDDDDEWRRDKIEKQLAAIRGCDAVLCAALSDGRVLRSHKGRFVTLDDLRRGSFDPSALLARTAALRDIGFDESLRQGEDWDAFIRLAQRYTIAWLREPLLLYNTGGHDRMTNQGRSLTGPELENRTAMLRKHRDFLGERWYRFHLARTLLGFIATRRDKVTCLAHAVRHCGVLPVAAVIAGKLSERVRWRWEAYSDKMVVNAIRETRRTG
jgi:glycosyltransferase involved in cell wall biosynthesis